MLHSPFEVRSIRAGTGRESTLQAVIDQVTDSLVNNHYKLIAKVENGTATKAALETEIVKIIDRLDNNIIPRDTIIKNVYFNIFGYGPLEPYISDDEVSDILINNHNTAFIKRKGKKEPIAVDFGSKERLLAYCRKVAAICGGRINENEAEVILTDRNRSLRIVISIEPINIGSPSISIRKPTTGFLLADLISADMIDKTLYNHLKEFVLAKETIIISGKGGSGKTTLLGALINEVPHSERGLLIQETHEITVRHPDVLNQLIKVSDVTETKNYTLFDLTRTGLLMSLDRMFIGELKDREAFDFFNAVFTGHTGSMATVHANSAKETIDRLILLMKRADTNLTGSYLKELLVSSLDQIIFIQDYKVQEVLRIKDYDPVANVVTYDVIFGPNSKPDTEGGLLKVGT